MSFAFRAEISCRTNLRPLAKYLLQNQIAPVSLTSPRAFNTSVSANEKVPAWQREDQTKVKEVLSSFIEDGKKLAREEHEDDEDDDDDDDDFDENTSSWFESPRENLTATITKWLEKFKG